MTTYYRPIFVSELDDPDHGVDDCVWTSGLMQANANSGGKHPATLAEAEAIEAAAGGPFPAGASSAQLVAGTAKRYGWAATIAADATAIVAAAKPGQALTLSGLYGNLSAHLRRFSPNFAGHHRIYCQVEDGPRYWWMDPLAPPGSGYVGEFVTLADVSGFVKGGSGGTYAPIHIVALDTHTLHLAPSATLLLATLKGTCISAWTKRAWGPAASSAPCSAPYVLKGCISGSATVVKVLAGVFAGQVVRASSPGVSVS